MVIKLLFIVLLSSYASCRNVAQYDELDEEDTLLLRAAYDAPSYDHDEYQEPEETGKLDLLKDGMWALKTKMKQLKVFDKALAANLLATKLQLKKLVGTLKKHQHFEVKKKPVYVYQSPAPAYHYEAPHYTAPAPAHHYSPPHTPQYSSPQVAQYGPPSPPKYDPPKNYEGYPYNTPAPLKHDHYDAPYSLSHKYEPSSHYEGQYPTPPKHEPPSHYEPQHYSGPAPPKYEPMSPQYPQVHIEQQADPGYDHDPYYGY